jgi:hypothetical protein
METFEIEVWEEMGGYMNVQANTREEAEEIAQQHIDDYGLNDNGNIKVRVTHRETHTQ